MHTSVHVSTPKQKSSLEAKINICLKGEWIEKTDMNTKGSSEILLPVPVPFLQKSSSKFLPYYRMEVLIP